MSKSGLIVAMTVVASAITILTFVTGVPNLPDFSKRASLPATERTSPTPLEAPPQSGSDKMEPGNQSAPGNEPTKEHEAQDAERQRMAEARQIEKSKSKDEEIENLRIENERLKNEEAARQKQLANLPPQITHPPVYNTAPPPPDRYVFRVSTNHQHLPPGTIIQVFVFDDNGIQHEASIVNATYNNYQLDIQLTEPVTSRGARVNWYIPPPRSIMSMPPLPTIEIPGMPTTRFKLR